MPSCTIAAIVTLVTILVLASRPVPAREAAGAVVVVDDRGRSLRIGRAPRRIVSMLPSLTETVCALQACDRLVGVDRWSDWPPQAAALPRVGGLEDTSIERVVALRPDLVLAPASSRAVGRLEALGLPVLALEPRGFDDTHRVLRVVAAALGGGADGDALWDSIVARIDAAAARVPASLRGARVYLEVSEVPHAAGEASFVGQTLARLGLANVVPAALGPFPQLAPEFVVRAAPDVIVATRAAIDSMPARPGWHALQALRSGRSCGIAADRWDVLVRPGPRLGEAAEVIADCLSDLHARAPGARGAPR